MKIKVIRHYDKKRFNYFAKLRNLPAYIELCGLEKRHPSAIKPEYDKKKNVWVVWSNGQLEYGSLDYIVSEYCKSGLYYPYLSGKHKNNLWQSHGHSFNDVLIEVMNNPCNFSIVGFEDFYSKQEIELLESLQRRLCFQKG